MRFSWVDFVTDCHTDLQADLQPRDMLQPLHEAVDQMDFDAAGERNLPELSSTIGDERILPHPNAGVRGFWGCQAIKR